MARNQSEKDPLPKLFPMPGAPSQDLAPKFHGRAFYMRAVLWAHVNTPFYHACHERLDAFRLSFTPDENREYCKIIGPASSFYRDWWRDNGDDYLQRFDASQSK